ncbi:SusD/RagB family nutrient-binding outer membrane lipoprotein [Pedobacter jejuensis]|uniref:SusD/RagB family nutrient-binding outer membrane lipoprotein n=1 Tax=Pedobacter jejuensis TaxID=1268550 RepID=A0A3N0BNT4_9SPHI|nr:SusD/RagB family nutrient-binding outer membrane lipoprotein [Pedobacter jejuensis]RNL50551.1 SusD/RagB family nutrient-binding outer membrane lipoprotein [Pedobacter jejuensis]
MHRLVVREDPNQYNASGSDFNILNSWKGMYTKVFTNLDFIISEGAAKGNMKYVGIAEILKAYGYSQMVDIYADVPFTDVNKLVSEGKFGAKFDKGADIYPQLIALLDKGIADLNVTATNNSVPGNDDVIYKGNISRWIKAANTIKLKLLLQQRLTKNVTADINALITANNLISSQAENFLLPFGPNGATDDRNPGFGDYFASQRSQYQSPWFYEILKGYNTKIYTGIKDPRLPYYIYNQLKPSGATANPTEYRDGAFLSIYFGSTGPNAAQSQQNYMSLFGIYPVGGRYDDGAGGTASATSGTGAAPYRFITYADVLFMKAELIKANVITGDAKAMLQSAITESFKQVDYIITNYVKPSQTVPAVSGTAASTSYINAIMAQYDAKPSQQLESIMTQKWISSYGSAVDAYTDYRRTGFPVLFDPSNASQAPGGKVQPPINGDPFQTNQPAVSVQVSKKYPLSLPWSSAELSANGNAPAQKTDPSTYKPFWLP